MQVGNERGFCLNIFSVMNSKNMHLNYVNWYGKHRDENVQVSKAVLAHIEVLCKNGCRLSQSHTQNICLLELMLYVPVNSNDYVGTLLPFYETFT